MANPSTLYRFRVDLSDIDRGIYETLDFRVAMHPSETFAYFLSRVIAYVANLQEGLEFTPGGLSEMDEPCLKGLSLSGVTQLWIEVGHPSMKKLNKATKHSPKVLVYTYKDPENLLRDMRAADIHKADQVGIFSLAPEFLKRLEKFVERDNRWGVILNEGTVIVNANQQTEQGEITRHSY